MASKFGRFFATTVEQCKPNLGLSYVKTEYSLNSVSRLICSSTIRFREHQQDDDKGQGTSIREVKIEHQSQGESDDVEDDENDGGDDSINVNEKTGEIGGPRGPEPTRYGDWEQKGRCSDF